MDKPWISGCSSSQIFPLPWGKSSQSFCCEWWWHVDKTVGTLATFFEQKHVNTSEKEELETESNGRIAGHSRIAATKFNHFSCKSVPKIFWPMLWISTKWMEPLCWDFVCWGLKLRFVVTNHGIEFPDRLKSRCFGTTNICMVSGAVTLNNGIFFDENDETCAENGKGKTLLSCILLLFVLYIDERPFGTKRQEHNFWSWTSKKLWPGEWRGDSQDSLPQVDEQKAQVVTTQSVGRKNNFPPDFLRMFGAL